MLSLKFGELFAGADERDPAGLGGAARSHLYRASKMDQKLHFSASVWVTY